MPKKHKDENIFKFKKFSDRIAEVDIRSLALYKIEHTNEKPDENRSYFYQTLDKWITLNLTEEFNDVIKQLKRIHTTNLPQLLHHKDKVIDILITSLEKATSLSLQPLLELTVSLARDLREDFYVHFQKFFDILIDLLKVQDPDQIEWTLICLAHLFKILKPFLCKELSIIIHRIIPLMSETNEKEYIINFAVECFAFIVRNLKDKDLLLLTILKMVKQDESCIMGCGKLFYEMVRGLNGQFHSKGEEFLLLLFNAFRRSEFKKYCDVLKEIMVQTIGDILSYVENKYISTFWNILHKSFQNIFDDTSLAIDEKSSSLHYLLHFLGQSVEYYGGQKIIDIDKIICLIIQVIDQDFSLEVNMTVSQIGAVLLLSKNFTIGQLEASRLSKKILNTEHVEVFESFVINTMNCVQFDILIMPDFIKFFECNLSKSTMEIMAKIIEVRKGNHLLDESISKPYNFHFKNQMTLDKISDCILNYTDIESNCEEFLLALHILPHIIAFQNEKIEKHLKKIIKQIILHINDSMKNAFLLAVISTTIHNISLSFESAQIMEIINSVLLVDDTFAKLRLLKYFIIIQKKRNQSSLNSELFNKIRLSIVENFLSEYQQIRLLTSQILASFDHLQIAGNKKESIYTIFRNIEEITPTIQTYRDQILLLQKLDYNSSFFQEIKNTEFADDALKFCIGFFHINFQPLWDPIKSILESYAMNFDINKFWAVFYFQLKNIRCEKPEASIKTFFNSKFLNENFKTFAEITDRYDVISYRIKLLQILYESKSIICDVKQRDIVELFFEFLNNEYIVDEKLNGEIPKARQKLLINHLQVLTKFTNPKCVSKTDELRKLYIEFLFHRNFQVQKLALDCLMHYKEIALTNYKEVLYNCVNEKTSRNEIVSLNLDEKIQNEHREEFIEIFLPILYSKLSIKANKKDQEGFKTKKEAIVRFMNHLKEDELIKLTNIAIGKISEVTWKNDAKVFIENINSVQFKANELQSKLQFLDLIKKNVAGSFSENYQRNLLRSILAIACCTMNHDIAIYKNLKQLCQHSITEFFEQYDNFAWKDEEIELIFEIFIWRYLNTFSKDASQNITGLMKLFVEWSKNPKYFSYFERKNNDGNYPIKSILELLTYKSTSEVVVECVMEILERLLTLVDEEEAVTTINYGTKLVEPFIQKILLKLKEKLGGKKSSSLNSRNLLILSRITELVRDKDSSKILLDILLPLTLRKLADESHDSDGVIKLLTTISNLLKVVDQPESYIRLFAPLFEHISEVNHRKFLVKTFDLLCQNDEFLKEIVKDINAFDKRWIERPDFERRLSAFHRLEKSDFSIETAVVIIYHCFHFLRFEKDLAIRDNSSQNLKMICSKIITKYSDDKVQLDYFIDKVVLNLLSKKIRGNAEMRTEAINLLGELARNHPHAHSILNDLHSLTDINNRELDFFDNITHLQKFRHMKALRRFVDIAKNYEKIPNLRTLNDFLLPISRIFLCTDEYQRKSKVVEAAIDYVACICKFLPWSQYESVLKTYLSKMRKDTKAYQKQLVKLIPSILDSFHYSLSTSDDDKDVMLDATQNIEDMKREEEDKEIKKQDEIDDDNDVNESDYEEELIDDEEKESSKMIESITVLRPNVSQRAIKSLTKRLIPSLFKIISELSNTTAHKLNKEERKLKEKSDMTKIPIALPLIKLLQKLPSKFLEQYLSQIVLKVSSFLKSTLKQVRATARHTLKEIIVSLGVEYLETVIENLSGILSKGFQLHVLSVTVHTLINALKSQLINSKTVTDNILQRVLNICFNDIFGKNNEEQEIGKIGNRSPEAKASRKSFLTLNILASTVSEKCILDLIIPFKNQLLETQSKKTVIKIQECLIQIASGFTINVKIPIDALMILVHGTISESIPNLLPDKKKFEIEDTKKNDCFILQEEPKRRGAIATNKSVKSSNQTNTYVLIEFGLEMLHNLMKKKKLEGAEGFLEPLISLLVDAMKGNYLRINMFAIRCFTIMWHHKMHMKTLKTLTPAIASEIFAILHKYATTEVSKKDNHYLLIKSAFKSVVVLIRHVNYYTVNENQLKVLLLYIEQDISRENDKDTISFVLLKAILDRKLIVPEIHDVMKNISEMSITSDIADRRNVIRPIILTYLMEYPLGKKIDQMLKFYIAQLNYEEISGRESAIEMIIMIFNHFPQEKLCTFSSLFFLSLATRLINDESPSCREKIALALELLITKVSKDSLLELYNIVMVLLKDKKLIHREMAAQLIIRFVNAADKNFITSKIPDLLSKLLKSISKVLQNSNGPGQYVRIKKLKLDEDDNDEAKVMNERYRQTIEDHHLIQTLNAIIKIFEYDDRATMKDKNNQSTINDIGFKVYALISHDHMWVRLRSIKIINLMIRNLDIARIHEILKNNNENVVSDEEKFLYSKVQFQCITFDMVVQIKPDIDQELLFAIFENLIEVAKVLKDVPFRAMVDDKKDFNLHWLIRRLRYAIHNEIAVAPKSCVLRKSVFNFFNNLLDIIDKRTIMKLASSMLTPLLREMVEGEHVIDELKQIALQVGNRIKTLIGLQEYDKVRLELQSKMLRKRIDRRKALAQEKINDPAKSAARTIMKQLKKQDNKKRKRRDIQEGIVLPKKRKEIFGNSMTDTYE